VETGVSDLKLPVSYQEQHDDMGMHYLATRLAGQRVCDQIREDRSYSHAGIHARGIRANPNELLSGLLKDVCLVSAPESPSLPIVRITASVENLTVAGMPVRLKTIAVLTPDGRRYLIKGGTAAPRSWIPLPIMGCWLNSGSPSWDCAMGFSRASNVSLISDASRFGGEMATLGKVLGLVSAGRPPHVDGTDDDLLNHLKGVKEQLVRRETQALDAAISDPMIDIGSVPFQSLQSRTDIIGPRVERMVSAIERGVALQHNARNNAQQMFHLLEGVPPDLVAPFVLRLEALYAKDRWFRFVGKQPEIVGQPITVERKR